MDGLAAGSTTSPSSVTSVKDSAPVTGISTF